MLDSQRLEELLKVAKEGDTLKRILTSHFDFGPNLLEHLLIQAGLNPGSRLKDLDLADVLPRLAQSLGTVSDFLKARESKGFLIQKVETRPKAEGGEEEFMTLQEFHPCLFLQYGSFSWSPSCYSLPSSVPPPGTPPAPTSSTPPLTWPATSSSAKWRPRK